jgi:mannose-1-phosphate guanylyltransferase/phosphomannomutase
MRSLVEQLSHRETVLIDGVKVLEEGGWALVVPDPEEPVTHIITEGRDDREAGQLAARYRSLIQELLALS